MGRHVEDERLGRLERALDHGDQLADLGPGRGRVAIQEALHDLGLEHDVRQALGRPVVHGPGDVAAEVLLGRQDHAVARAAGVDADARPRAPAGRPQRPPAAGSMPARRATATAPVRDAHHDTGSAGSSACPRARPIWASIMAARLVSVTSWRVQVATPPGPARAPPRVPPGCSADWRPLLLVAARLACAACPTSMLDLGQLAVEPLDLARRAAATRSADRASRTRPSSGWRVSPPASGSSPGAWRRPRPGSGR